MTAGAVLCGGQSRRMGTDKSFVEVDGVPMAARVATALTDAECAPVVLVGGDSVLLTRLGWPTVADRWPGEGPAGGVLTALDALDDDLVVVAACDLPLLDAPTVAGLVAAMDADPHSGAAVAVTDRPQPALTCWRRSVAMPRLEVAWGRGARSLGELLAAVPSAEIPVSPDAVRNANTTDELAEIDTRPRYIEHVSIQEIDVDQLATRLEAGGRVVDVREPDEYAAGHVPGALLVPLGTVAEHLDAFEGEGGGDGPTYVICKSGGRSMRACEIVAERRPGVEVVNVSGGTMAWIASGRETVTHP